MNSIQWGIIGCGDVTEMKSGPAFQKVPHSKLVAVMRRNASKAADYAQRHNVPRWYSDAGELINDPEVNAVYVATPPSTHALYAKMAIEAGKPVYIEKPMCRTYRECEEVNRLASEKNVKIFVAYYRRYLPGFLKVKEMVENAEIGGIRMVNIRLIKHAKENSTSELPWRVKPGIAGGGHFYDLASHQFDYLDYLFGSVSEIKSFAGNQLGVYPAEDILTASWKHVSGVFGSGAWCFNAAPWNDTDVVEIIGSKGRIEFSTFDFTPVKLIKNGKEFLFDYPKPEHVQYNLIEKIVNELRGQDKAQSTGISAARTNKVLEEAVKKYYEIDKQNNK